MGFKAGYLNPAINIPSGNVHDLVNSKSVSQGYFDTFNVSLGVAQNLQQLPLAGGNFIQVVDGTPGSSANLFFDQNPKGIPVYPGWSANIPFSNVYMTNSSQLNGSTPFTMTLLSSPIRNFSKD